MLARAALSRPGKAWAYTRAVISGIGSKLVAGGCGMAMLWLLNAILGKEDFAYCMIGLTLNQTVALVVASGFEKTVIYHVSRLDHVMEGARSRRLAGAGLCGAAGVALILAAIVFTFAEAIAGFLAKPEAGVWIRIFVPVIPLSVINTVQTAWIRARQMVPTFVLFGEVLPDTLRVILLGLVWLFAGSTAGVGGALAAALIIPVVWLFRLQPTPPVSPRRVFTGWDVRYGLTVMLTRLADQRIQSISVLLVGILSTAAVTAEFVLAARFALLLASLQQVLNLLLVPRLGALMARGSSDGLIKEYDTTRFVALVATIGGAVGYLLFAPVILPLFGNYGEAYPMLLILSAGMIVRVGFGASGTYLIMSGYAGWRLLNSLGSLLVIAAMSYLLVPSYSGDGAAAAALLSIVFANGMAAVIIWRLDKLAIVTSTLVAVMALSSVVLLAAAFGLVPPLAVAACLSLIGLWVLFSYREMWTPWVSRLLKRKSVA